MKWLPLPKIAHAIAIYPFSPSTLQQQLNTRPLSSGLLSTQQQQQQTDDASIYTSTSSSSNFTDQFTSSTNPEDYSQLISLEVGDELYIIEQQGQWYRGYVLCPVEEGRKPNKAPIGVFPRSHVQIKEYIDIDPDEADALAFKRRREISSELSTITTTTSSTRPLSEIPNGLPRSFSESYIGQSHFSLDSSSNGINGRPGSFGDLNFELESDFNPPQKPISSSSLHIPPPPLPLARFDQSTVTGSSEPLVDEIAACISDWNSLLYTYVNNRQYSTFNTVKEHINYLFQARRQLLDQALSREELIKLRREIVHRMVISNLEQQQDMIIRHPEKGYLLDGTNASISTIYRMHYKYATLTKAAAAATSTANSQKLLEKISDDIPATNGGPLSTPLVQNTPNQQPLSQQPKGAKFHHLFFELKAYVAYICQVGEYSELYFALYSASEKKFLTEQFLVVLTYNGMPKDEEQIGKLQTLFVDLSLHDLTDNVYLVCHIVRLGSMKLMEKDHFPATSIFHSNKHQSFLKPTTSNMYRRPFGCAVLKLSSLLFAEDLSTTTTTNTNSLSQPSSVEYDMPIFTSISESNYTTLHEDIIFNNFKEFQKNPRAEMLKVSVRTFYGYLGEVLKTNAALLQDVPQTLRLGFADVVFPDDSRNELYIKLDMGDFTQFGRSRNIQVTMCVRDNKTGDVIDNAIYMGSGSRPVTYWESMVMYHEQRPKWGETVKISISDIQQWERSHVFLTVKHKSSNSHGSGSSTPILKFASSSSNDHVSSSGASSSNEKILAMGFLPLFLPPLHRDFVADGTHTLNLYKYDKQSALPRCYLDNMPWCVRSSSPSNTLHQSVDHFARVRSPPPHTKKLGHHYSPSSSNSFKSNTGSLNSAIPNSASTSTSDVTHAGNSSPSTAPCNKLTLLRDTVTLSTFLCSNKFTQNKTLVKLLNWRTLLEDTEDGTVELLSVLDQFTFVGEVEVVKFLGDIFDALLDILAHQHDEDLVSHEINDAVLAAIIWLLGIVQDRRFSNFRPVLDVYIENRFTIQEHERQYVQHFNQGGIPNYSYRPAPETTFEHLLQSMTRLCENPGEPSKAKRLRSSMKVWDYLFRFIVRSRLNQQQKEDDEERAETDVLFKNDLDKLLSVITAIMSPEQPSSMIGTQTLALQHFSDILEELSTMFTPQQVIEIAISFVDACSHVTGRLVGFKLAMILNIVKGSTFNDISCRLALTKNVFRWIQIWVDSYGSTAKNVIFARQVEQQEQQQQGGDANHGQTRLPRGQWIENLRLSLTIISEVLDKVRKSFGMTSSGLTSSSISSPSFSNFSRPTSLSTLAGEDEAQDFNQTDLNSITEVILQLVPQLLNAYKELQKMVIQAMQVPSATAGVIDTTKQRPSSRQSFSVLRERASSIGGGSSGKNPLVSSDILQELKAASTPSSNVGSPVLVPSNGANVVLQALSTSPTSPFPSTYPFPPAASQQPSSALYSLSNEQSAMISTGLMDLTVVILELFYLAPKQQWINFIKRMYEQDGVEMTAEFLRKVVFTCMAILFGDNVSTLEESSLTVDGMANCEQDENRDKRKLPQKWLNLGAITHRIILRNILDPIKSIFEIPAFTPTEKAYLSEERPAHEHDLESVIDEEEEEEEETVHAASELNYKNKSVAAQRSALLLWRIFFVGFLRVVGSPMLDVSASNPQVQRATWKIIGNMRGEVGAKLFLSLWKLAGRSVDDVVDSNKSAMQSVSTDYFGNEINTSGHISHSPVAVTSASDFNYMSDDSLRKSMASIEEVDDDEHTVNYSVRNSLRIGPMDDVPLSSIHEEHFTDNGYVKHEIPFLQSDLSYFILSPMCAVSLTLHDRVRSNAISVIADIIAFELYTYDELMHVQRVMISTLDRLVMSEEKGDDVICARMTVELNTALEQRLQSDDRTDLIAAGGKAVDSLCRFLSLLLQIRSLPVDDDEFMDERITATLKLMKFIQVIEREEIYIKYVHQLVQLHLDSRNFIEAALTLRFHADLLRWDPSDKLAPIPELGLPSQSSFSRKEGLYMKMITYLDQGSAWEICINLCKELAYEYENTLYDYTKLGDILQRQAALAENIVKKERCFTEYFRVGFYGRGFPASNRNQQYIYRGLEWEKMPSFIERMQNRHPNAQLLPSKVANSISISEEQLKELESTLDGQYLQITSVTPVPDVEGNPCLSNPIAPDSIKKYYNFNNVSKFSFSRPVIRESASGDSKQPESDFLNLWTEKVDFECEDRFPTIVRRSKIVHSHLSVVSPIENAVTAMENKNEELLSLEKKYSAHLGINGNRRPSTSHQNLNINPFSMSLNGAVDAPVNGGVPLYKKAFLSKSYYDKNPDMRGWIHRLQEAIRRQVRIIKKCLDTHNKLVSLEMRPFHVTLTEFFQKNFADEIKSIKEKNEQEAQAAADHAPLHMATSSILSRRRSTLSSTTDNTSGIHAEEMHSLKSRQASISQTPGIGGVPILPALPLLSPISRAFSIRSSITESTSGLSTASAFENATMSRAESISRTLKMSLRSKKSRKKSQSAGSSQIIPNSPTPNSKP